jgi:hypothetical protein
VPSGIREMTTGLRIDRSYRELPAVIVTVSWKSWIYDEGTVLLGTLASWKHEAKSTENGPRATRARLSCAHSKSMGLRFDRCESSLLL